MVGVQFAQAQPAAAGSPTTNGTPVVARFPQSCALDYLQVRTDSGSRILLPQAVGVAALRKQVIGPDLALSIPDLGILVLRDFVAAAGGNVPPVLVLADGTALTAFQVLAWPDSVLAVADCAPSGQSEVAATTPAPAAETANILAQVAPASGPTRIDALSSDPAAVALREGGRGVPGEFSPSRAASGDSDRSGAGDAGPAERAGGRGIPDAFTPNRGRTSDSDAIAPVNPITNIAQVEQPSTGGRDIDLVRSVVDLINILDLGSQNSTAVLPTVQKTVYSPVGAIFDAGLINAGEGVSIYGSGIGQLLGPPNLANVTVIPDPILRVTLQSENTNSRDIVGVYQFTADGRVTDVDILWLNTNLIPRSDRLLPDFLGQVGDQTTDLLIPPDTRFGYFMIADGGGGRNGATNQAMVLDLFADLRVNPRTFNWEGNIDLINQHVRFDPQTGRILIETDPGVFRPLTGDTFFSHDPRFNTDFRGDLSLVENSHTITGQANSQFWIAFEDTPFTGAITRNATGRLVSMAGNDLDYNDVVLSSVIEYPPVTLPGAFQPLGALGQRFDAVSDFVSTVTFSVSGLGADGVALALGRLGQGFTLSAMRTDAFGNGTYKLNLPGPIASTSAVVEELNKVLIAVDDDAPTSGRTPVSTSFALTDIYGSTAVATSSLSFTPPAATPRAPDSGGEASTAPTQLATLIPLQEAQTLLG